MNLNQTPQDLEKKVFQLEQEIKNYKNSELEKKASEERFRLLNNLMTEMLEIDDIKNIYKFITSCLSKHYPDTIILFNSIDEGNEETCLEAISGIDSALLSKIINISKINLLGRKFQLCPRYTEFYKSCKLVNFNGGLVEFSAGQWPFYATKIIEKLLGINKIYTIGITKDNLIYASLHFFTLNEYEITDYNFIETFVKQAGIILQIKQVEKALKESEQKLKKLNSTKDKLFSIIAHDLRSPFNAILGYSKLLKDECSSCPNDNINNINSLYKSVNMTKELLENLLLWANSQSEEIKFEQKSLSLESLIKQSINVVEQSANQKKIALNYFIEKKINVFVDEEMIGTILRNLLSNAIKFTHANGNVNIKVDCNDKFAQISISDSGIGMNKEVINNLFRLDKKASTLGTENEKGSGLGLILCKEFVEKHGGKIWAKSESDMGSTFSFTLPLA
ncbi:MAG: HAMP domain-containing histidine kinase [Ignavibacteriales bacterium]|nr:HAMP domain-containing histidine kinase [Ignavibacteriales bacterium]